MARRRRIGNWSVLDLERLRTLFPVCAMPKISAILGRSPASIRTRAARMFKSPVLRGPWTRAADESLRAAWGVVDVRDLALVLARTQRDLRARAESLRANLSSGPWRRSELQQLKRRYASRTDGDLEVSLGRPQHEIAAKAAELCLRKDKSMRRATNDRQPMPRWNSADEAKLRQLYSTLANQDVAAELGRSVASVANKANQLGLSKSKELRKAIGRANVHCRLFDDLS